MISTTKFIILLFFFSKKISAQDEENESILCSAKTCVDYLAANPCKSDNCKFQNSSSEVLVLPGTDPCNCCPFCLKNLKEGDDCAIGAIGDPVPNSICGPGLVCVDSLCAKMSDFASETCSGAQNDYDLRRLQGNLGALEVRPICDDDGFYLPYKCILGQTCFCVDKEGNRIFGEIPYTSTADLILKCECSRKHNDILKFFDRESLYPNQYFRCTPNGDYDTIQCIGDNCMCTDAQDGVPTFPTRPNVNISDISNNTLPQCFKQKIHETGKFYHSCAEEFLKVLAEVEDYRRKDGFDTVFEVDWPSCDLEGRYAPVQKDTKINDNNEVISYYYCANVDKTPIENYTQDSAEDVPINCNCARTRLLLPEDAPEKPQCCSNGNFNPVQCRRGTCYCVDENGYQNAKNSDEEKKIEVDVNEKVKLFCYDAEEQQRCLGTSL